MLSRSLLRAVLPAVAALALLPGAAPAQARTRLSHACAHWHYLDRSHTARERVCATLYRTRVPDTYVYGVMSTRAQRQSRPDGAWHRLRTRAVNVDGALLLDGAGPGVNRHGRHGFVSARTPTRRCHLGSEVDVFAASAYNWVETPSWTCELP